MPTPNLTAFFDEPIGTATVGRQRVYTRSSWAEDWEEQEYLYCTGASWGLLSQMGSAQLTWNYGRLIRFDLQQFIHVLPEAGERRYVKVVWENASNIIGSTKTNLVWYGEVLGLGGWQGGVQQNEAGTNYEMGQQTLQCVGLEKILEDTIVRTSAWYDYDEDAIFNTDRGLVFNDLRADHTPGGDRTLVEQDGTYVFSGRVLDDDAFWTTKDCLQYLAKYHPPKDKEGAAKIPFVLSEESLTAIAAWNDRPTLPTHGRSLRSIINQLLTNERLLSSRLIVNGSNQLELQLTPWNGDIVVLPSGGVIMPNSRRWLVDVDRSRGDVARVLSHAHGCDRVRIQGARATSTFSISYDDDSLETGHTSTLKTEYQQGGSTADGYTDLSVEEKRKRNAAARSLDKYQTVFRYFRVPYDWDGVAKNGEGDGGTDFQPIVTDTPRYRYNKREFRLEKHLPMRDGYKYETLSLGGTENRTPPVKVSEGPFNHLPPLVVIQVPNTERWEQIEKAGTAGAKKHRIGQPNRSWSARVRIPERSRGLMIDVVGEAQHVIAGTDFTPLNEAGIAIDLPQNSSTAPSLGAWDWRKMICTVCAKWDAYCEGVYPQFPSVPEVDAVREVVLKAAETFRLDWLVPQTVIGITNDGQLVRSTSGGWINDDRQKLEDRACMAYAWYGIERRSIEWSSRRINGSILPGDYVAQLGSSVRYAVNSLVTQVSISCPLGTETSPPPDPVISYRTDFITDFDLYLDGVARLGRSDAAIDRLG